MLWRNQVLEGHVLARLADLPDESVHCVVTSPPYWGLRDYGVEGQIGLEPSMGEFLERMVAVFREVRRVLRRDGTLWLNMGDTYNTCAGAGNRPGSGLHGDDWSGPKCGPNRFPQRGLKPKDLCGIPWRLAFALQDEGWWLRSDIIWAKPNPMPSSVTDRPGVAHEYIFLLTKSARYFYDADAVREPSKSMKAQNPRALGFVRDGLESDRPNQRAKQHRPGRVEKVSMKAAPLVGAHGSMGHDGLGHRYDSTYCNPAGRNMRTVWEIAVNGFSEAHFATFPPKLVEPCIKAGCPRGGIVLDPFMGSGTTALVALSMGRDFVGIELNPDYAAMARRRISEKQEGLRLLEYCRSDAPERKAG